MVGVELEGLESAQGGRRITLSEFVFSLLSVLVYVRIASCFMYMLVGPDRLTCIRRLRWLPLPTCSTSGSSVLQ